MKPADFWKNFNLGEELSISGAFIYDGMRGFHQMKNLDIDEELFIVLYNLSVGIERLLKISVVLLEYDELSSPELFEKSLITHNHRKLLARIKKKVDVNFGTPHNDFLDLLSAFYKSLRYSRFSLSSVYSTRKEQKHFCDFLSKQLVTTIDTQSSLLGLKNDNRYRQFISNLIIKISSTIYGIISEQARSLNLYTYELRHGSKAESIFLSNVNISDEDVLWKELLVFLMNTKNSSGYLKFLRNIPPLAFDPALIDDYLDCFQTDTAKALVMGELEQLYEQLANKTERLEIMNMVGLPGVHFYTSDDEDINEI